MALTTAYSVTPLLTRTVPAADPAENSDTVGLAGGGFATVADAPDGLSVPTFYDAAGNEQPQLAVNFATDAKIAQLTDGDVVIAGTHPGGGIDFMILTSTGAFVSAGPITSDTHESNADVAALGHEFALADGGFVIVSQNDLSAGAAGNHDIVFRIVDSTGTVRVGFYIDTSTANDQNASVAVLADGGYAVAWERIDAGGNSAAWVAVYNANGSVRKPPYQFDASGHQMSVTALRDGGFAVGYQEHEPGQADIRIVTFNSTGISLQAPFAGVSDTDETQAAVTTLSNGLVMSTFTNLFDAESGSTDIRGALIDPAAGIVLTDPLNPLTIASGDSNSESSISALGLAQFVVSYSDAVAGDVTQKTFQLIRTANGDGADDSFAGDDAVDIVNGLGGDDNLAGGANADTLSGGNGNDYLNGGAGDDLLKGDAAIDYLVGSDGNDTLIGGAGGDAMLGGLGNDLFYVDNAGDEISESVGNGAADQVATNVSYALTAGAEVEKFSTTSAGGTTAISLTGNAFAQTITGNAGANILKSGGGADIMKGLGGNDAYYVDSADDVVVEGSGQGTADSVAANVSYILGSTTQVEVLRTTSNGGTTAINLTGNAFAQTVTGNAGGNVLNGGAGTDTLLGLGGNDFFVFNTALGSGNIDTLADFNVAADTIRLENAIFIGLPAGNFAASAFFTGTAAHDADDRIIYNSATGNVAYDADGTGATGAVRFATLHTGLALTNSDFVVI